MTRAILAALGLALVPAIAEACAVCLDSAYGDRSFNRAFALFMLTPFAVAAALAGVLVWLFRARPESADGTGQGSGPGRPMSS